MQVIVFNQNTAEYYNNTRVFIHIFIKTQNPTTETFYQHQTRVHFSDPDISQNFLVSMRNLP